MFKRSISIIPPRVSSIKEIGKLTSNYPQAHPQLFSKMKQFYSKLPKGNTLPVKPTTLSQKYYQKYIATSSKQPLVHFLMVMIPVGYYVAYFKGGHYHPRFEFH